MKTFIITVTLGAVLITGAINMEQRKATAEAAPWLHLPADGPTWGGSVSINAYAKPDPRLTPGSVRTITKHEVCTTSWGHDVRHITTSMKRQVAAAYGVPWQEHAQYEFDHLIPRALGGADEVSNLWPQPRAEAVHIKDPLEVKLWKMVCHDQVTLKVAQDAFAHDWRLAVGRY